MKALNPEAEIAAVVDKLFRRWPWLVGFSVQEARTPSPSLVVTDVETDPWDAKLLPLHGEIAEALLGLAEDDSEARELMRGRTFARRLH
jgi:hypothetical protein